METEQWSSDTVNAVVAREVERQDARYGGFDNSRGSVRLALACLEDETREAREAWEKWKRGPDWYSVRSEAIQVAAIAHRLARDLIVEITD